ncbi:hypothetical protein KSF_088670 [Reticulibacter mediterranei]|uniref:Uncharacterized protein n=1 Tax=Reticulibacter mediterranei TaxID=2778369 RepID=A0A8J3IND3_9CHLR|nr:hypothetical protein [Reticulibacter mediterranei]GHO98819.1 hypothetical protein KSF_088670 [Reticulibacter mediterranei]
MQKRFRRALQAIMYYNDRTDIQEESRWFINPAVIVDLVGGRHAAIKKYLDDHKEEIDEHHKRYGLSAKFNRKPVDIKKRVIIAEEPSGYFCQMDVSSVQADRDY